MLPIVVLGLAALHQAGLHVLVSVFSDRWNEPIELMIYGFTGSVVAWIGLSRLASTLAAQSEAEARMQSAYKELEANHQKLLTLNHLGEQVASADNEQAVLELAAKAPLQLTSARASTVVTFDDAQGRLKLDMAWGLSENYLRALRGQMDKGIPFGRCKSCTHLKTDVSSDCPLFDGLHHEATQEGIHGLVCLPMSHEQERVGIISAYFPSVDGPPEDQMRLLNILNGSITAMLESQRLRARQVDTLYALDQVSQTTDMGTSALNDFALQILNITVAGWQAHAGGLFLYDWEAQTWTCYARMGLGEDLSDPRFAFALEYARQVQGKGYSIITSEFLAEAKSAFSSAATAPLVAEGKVLGAIFLGARRKNAFQKRHTELLDTMAHQVALAIRNVQLYAQLDQLAILKERYRLSREIHDGLAQTLAYLNIQTERLAKMIAGGQNEKAMREIGEMRQSISSAFMDAREAIEGLRLDLDQPGHMTARLSEYVTLFERRSGIQTDLVVEPRDLLIPPPVGLQLLRIVQEALTNVRKHAQADRAEVCLTAAQEELVLSITDNGHGFPETLPTDLPQQHVGLTTMRERARSLGGVLTVATSSQQGTRISVTLPLSSVKINEVYP